jgi:hypothetical protein
MRFSQPVMLCSGQNHSGRTRSGVWPLLLVAAMLPVMTTGCQTPRAGEPLSKEHAGSDPDSQINFWHALAGKPVTSNDEALHGLLLYMDGKDDSPDYPARIAALKRRKMLPLGWYEPPTAAVKRGTVAVAVMRMLNEKGGVTTRLFGPSPRYAVRELMFLNVYPHSTPNQTFSGNEFVGIIGACEDYQRGSAETPAAVSAAVPPTQPPATP